MRLRRHGHEDVETEQQPPIDWAGGSRRLAVFWEGGSILKTLPADGALVIGRSVECDLQIDHTSVSRKHITLHVGANLVVEDLGSSNGTRINGTKIGSGERVRIGTGDVVELGSAMLVVQPSGSSGATTPDPRASARVEATIPPPPETMRALAPGEIAAADPAMQQLHRLVAMVARTSMSVLVRGETGAGKEVVAGAIHRLSPRADRPLVCINCAALPEALLESELFGYERGAFTGAHAAKPGLLESAHGGTVFLDEIGEMPLATQAKLLRVLESREVTRLGSLRPVAIDVRFVAATNRDLDAASSSGAFRPDLYFRLNGVTVVVPPLRERRAEIVPLAEQFATRAAAEMGKPLPPLSRQARAALTTFAWPGNVRQLKSVVERAVLFATEERAPEIDLPHLPDEVRARKANVAAPAPTDTGLRGEVEAFERKRIADALERCSGNQTRAAELLGISRRTLVSRLDAYGLPRPRPRK